MRPIPIGTKGIHEFVVTREDLAGAMEPSLPPVLATCMMSLAMELAAMDAISPYRDAGEMSVGAVVNVSHLAATPEGWKVRAEAEVTKSDGRRIEFNVSAFDEQETIGKGTHSRAVIDRGKFDQRFDVKVKSR
jgi:predicted thioesterase